MLLNIKHALFSAKHALVKCFAKTVRFITLWGQSGRKILFASIIGIELLKELQTYPSMEK